MGLTTLRAFLRRHDRVALDTNVFIYHLDAHPRYVAITDLIFGWLEQSGRSAVTSTITMTELLVQPYRKSNEQQVDQFYGLLATYPSLEWIAPTLRIADTAAKIRGWHGLRTPDALQAATAIDTQATALITNDPVFARLKEFETLVLDSLL